MSADDSSPNGDVKGLPECVCRAAGSTQPADMQRFLCTQLDKMNSSGDRASTEGKEMVIYYQEHWGNLQSHFLLGTQM